MATTKGANLVGKGMSGYMIATAPPAKHRIGSAGKDHPGTRLKKKTTRKYVQKTARK